MHILRKLFFFLFLSSRLFAQELLPPVEWYKAKDTLVINKAISLYEVKKYSEARKQLGTLPQKIYALEPWVLRFAGLCFYYEEKYENSVVSLSLALAYAPQSIGLYYDRAFALMKWQKYRAAASDFAAYYAHYPEDKLVLLNLSLCLAEDGQVENAIHWLAKHEPMDSQILAELGYYYMELEKYDQALVNLEKALELDPVNEVVLENISIGYAELFDYEKAFEYIDRLIKQNENYGRAYYLKGTLYEDLGDDLNAEKFFALATEKGYKWDD